MTRFLIAGLGSVGRRHLRNLKALGEHDIVLLRSGKSTLPEDELAGLPRERDLEVALARWRPEGVIVANPTAYHLDVAIPSARAGCHLLIEKPISHSLARMDDLRSAAAQGGARILVGFQFRFHPGLQEVRRAIEAGRIGRPVFAAAHYGDYLPDWHPWEDYRLSYAARADLGGGVILTLSHPFDYLRWILGEAEPLTSVAGTFGDLGLTVEDMAEVTLGFPGGALGTLHLDYLQTPPSHWVEIVGSLGTVHWDGSDGAVRRWTSGEEGWTVTPAPEGFDRNSMFLEEMRHFVSVVRGQVEPRVTLEDGARALELAVWALSSAQRPAAHKARSEGER
jgi:predicted dehydrogenase